MRFLPILLAAVIFTACNDQKRAEIKENNKKILDLIARKQDEALEKKSISQLEKMLESDEEEDEDE